MTVPTKPMLTDTMPAAVYQRPGEVAVEQRPVPDVGPNDLLIEVDHCGVCGSDLHMMMDGWGKPGAIEGHEYTGRVAAVGADVTGWSVGDPVVGGPARRCGRCRYCQTGRPSLCVERNTPGIAAWQGAFARYKALPAAEAIPVPAGLSLRHAALAEPLAVALHGITLGRVEPGRRVLVMGAGPIGALTVAALADRGVEQLAVCEPNPGRQALARGVGAQRVVTPDDLDRPGMHEPDRIVDDAVDVVLECSGKAAAMEAGLAQLDRAGTLVLVGAGIEPPRFDPNRILLNELVITGSFCYDAGGFPAALELLASGRLPVDELIEPQDVGLAGLAAAMRDLVSGSTPGKILIAPALEEGDG